MFRGATPRIFIRALVLRLNETEAEKLLWEFLKKKQLLGFKFRRQHAIAHSIVDFYCHAARLAVEIDGPSHNSKQQIFSDKVRTDELNRFGIDVVRFTNDQILHDMDLVLKEIAHCLERKNAGGET